MEAKNIFLCFLITILNALPHYFEDTVINYSIIFAFPAAPVSPCINYMQFREGMQYPWGYALPVSHIISTCESYPQYPWGYAVPVSHIFSTCENIHYTWVISWVPVSHTRLSSPSLPSALSESDSVSDGLPVNSAFESFWYFWDKLGILYFWSLFKAVQYDSRILHILTGTEDMTHGYWGYDSRVLHTLTGTEDITHGYCISSQVLRIWLTGAEDMTHGYWGYGSQVLHILTGTEDMIHGYCISLEAAEDMTRMYCISSRVLRVWLTGT